MKRVLRLALFAALLLIPTVGQSEYREESLDNDYRSEIEALAEEGKFLILFSIRLVALTATRCAPASTRLPR
ncbi:MAG: hypothetical protein ISR53_09205 [Rhodospirillales bacterium]|nr:hypothetical protein [Rhodospirillales bacterium]